MKHFYALFVSMVFVFQLSAQYVQNFDTETSLTSGCNLTVSAARTTVVGEVISGTGSLYSTPTAFGIGTRDYSTPWLNVNDAANQAATTTSLNISFKYKLTEELTGPAARFIRIGLQSQSGITYLAAINMNKDNTPMAPVEFSHSFIVPTGVYRLVLKMGGAQGNNSTRIIIDDVQTSANAYYSLNGTCNTAPVVTNDIYFTSNQTGAVQFTSVLANDIEPNNERFAQPSVTTVSADGTVSFNNDGSFTFTPNPGFSGISTSFTYTVFDKGYDAMSGSGIVTIYFTSSAVLPVKLTGFTGLLVENKAMLNWSVANNEEVSRMEIEKSTNGKDFSAVSIVLPTTKQSDEKYEFQENKTLTVNSYFRLKLVDKNNKVSYSGVIVLSIANTSEVLKLTGNPVRNTLRFSFLVKTGTTGVVNVFDISGKKLISQQLKVQKGSNSFVIELDQKITAGTYLLELTAGSERSVARFVKE